jgi:predicted TPR repeat methyltransferase
MSNPERILQDLKKRLADLSAPHAQLQVFAERDVEAEYELDISAFRAVVDEEKVILVAACDVINAHISQTEAFNLQPYYRICSLGCGNGAMDKKILQQISQLHPGLKFQYVGLDNNETSLTKAMDTLSGELKNIDVTLRKCDVEKVHPSEFEKFDMMVAIHSMTYMNSLGGALSKFVELLKPAGELFMIHCGDDSPLYKISEVFLQHQSKKSFPLSKGHILSVLSEMKGIMYSAMDCDASFDMQKFTSDKIKMHRILDFIAHVPLQAYPSDIAHLSLKYLHAVDKETAGKMIRMNSMTVVKCQHSSKLL